MDYNEDKVDQMVLALMYLTRFSDGESLRSWKGFDSAALGRLHKAGFILNPVGKAKSVVLTGAEAKRSEELFEKQFGTDA